MTLQYVGKFVAACMRCWRTFAQNAIQLVFNSLYYIHINVHKTIYIESMYVYSCTNQLEYSVDTILMRGFDNWVHHLKSHAAHGVMSNEPNDVLCLVVIRLFRCITLCPRHTSLFAHVN